MSSQLETRTDLQIPTETDAELDDKDPIMSHIIAKDETASAAAKTMEAYVEGTVLTALCGHKWVPSKDPMNHPICPKCLEIWHFDKQFNE